MIIDPSAHVAEGAQLGEGTSVGPGAIIEDGVRVGIGCTIAAYAIIRRGTTLGESVQVDSFAVLGGEPQSLGFDPSTESYLVVGDRTVIREAVTIHRGSSSGAMTSVGEDCLLMANSHVAHDCMLGHGIILANNAMIAGHIHIGEKTFVGGGAAIHQFCRVGAHCMIAGNATITADVPPYIMAAERNGAHGLNLIGLRRNGFTHNEIKDLKRCYRAVYFRGGNLKRSAGEAALEAEFGTTEPGARFLNFFETGQRGFVQSTRD
jgi:UDP-N-acetylglucosamine acyltransferase